jgi:membrane-bound serine protease (ClpP class)
MKTNVKPYILLLLSWTLLLSFSFYSALAQPSPKRVMTMEIKDNIDPRMSRYVRLAMEEAERIMPDYVLIEMDTYGGALNDADEIRKLVMQAPMPVLVFIDNNAASAGALISIACDSIYMAPGANIGAATVVGGDGKPAPPKYQSYMRSLMRSTAETNNRDPRIAEQMVGTSASPDTTIQNLEVLTLTTSEAIAKGYSEGMYNSVPELLAGLGMGDAEVIPFRLDTVNRIVSFFLNPLISGVLLMLILGGLYFELQTPGVGFPLAAAILAGILYLTPYYLTGLAANWEILALIIGIALILLEVLVIPGFGIAGISGIILTFGSLLLIMIDNNYFDFTFVDPSRLTKSLIAVVAGLLGAIVMISLTWNRVMGSKALKRIVLSNTFESSQGYRSSADTPELIGRTGVTHTRLAPTGRIWIDGALHEAQAWEGFIEQGQQVIVTDQTIFSLKVKKLS